MIMIMMDHWPRQGNATLEKHAGHEKRYAQPASLQRKHIRHSKGKLHLGKLGNLLIPANLIFMLNWIC